MAYSVEVLCDSLNPLGVRLTTMRVQMPRFILAEFNTHRQFSRNAGSSRAISTKRRLEQVENDPVFPLEWGLERKGMSASELLTDPNDIIDANCAWKDAANYACQQARALVKLGVHKQVVNRLLEPFTWVSVIVSSTEWDNFFTLRISPKAQPEIKLLATNMQTALHGSTPRNVGWGEWHLPLATRREVAVGRLARVSYETSGKTEDEDAALCQQLMLDGHWSPFEHVAQARKDSPQATRRNYGEGWIQWRAMLD